MAQLSHLLAGLVKLFQHLLDLAGELLRRCRQQRCGLLERVEALLDQLVGASPGDRFDAADAGGRAAFAGDQEQADIAGLVDVRAAAQLVGEKSLLAGSPMVMVRTVSPYFSPNSAMAPSPIACCSGLMAMFRRIIAQDGPVDAGFDLLQLLGCHRLRVGEVEAQPVGGDQRAGLAGMLAQHAAQLGVQQVGGGVVAHDVLAALGVHPGDRQVAHLGLAAHHLAVRAR